MAPAFAVSTAGGKPTAKSIEIGKHQQVQPISVVVLAGGASRRMGTNKALLPISEKETLIARVVANVRPLSSDIIVVSNTPELYAELGIRQVGDEFPGCGPLAGIQAGLKAAVNNWSLVIACDMPLVDHRLVRYMILLSQGHDAVVPRGETDVEPLHALYSKACLPVIEEQLLADQRRVVSFFPSVKVRYVEKREVAIFDAQGRTFFNANTPEDWIQLQATLRSGTANQ